MRKKILLKNISRIILLELLFVFGVLFLTQSSYSSGKKVVFSSEDSKVDESGSIDELEEYDYFHELAKIDTKPRFGLFGNFGLNFHHTNFRYLPGIENCCTLFDKGFGTELETGLSIQFFLNNKFSYGSRIFFGKLNGSFTNITDETMIIEGTPTIGNIENKLNISNNVLGIAPFVGYKISQISSDLYSYLGFKVATSLAATFSQYEKLVAPSVGSFGDGRRMRNIKYGDLPDKNSFLFAAMLGFSYEFPLNKTNTLRVAPEIYYNYWLNSPVKDLSWNISQLTFGAAIKYIAPPPPPPPPAEPALPYLPDLPLPVNKNIFTADVVINRVEANYQDETYEESKKSLGNTDPDITIEDFTYVNLKPLLNYIFFDENSYEIPRRYKMYNKKQADEFSIKRLQQLGVIDTYYQVLNIIGYRMRENKKSNIEIIGNNSGTNDEKDNLVLSKNRAIAVKNYLVDVWRIEEDRIKITARNLPSEPTRSSVDDAQIGDQENRRVEIISDDVKITESILSYDTLKVLKSKNFVFGTDVKSTFGIKNWEFIICQDNLNNNNNNLNTNISTIKTWSGAQDIPEEIIWEAKNVSNIDANKNIQYFLTVTDNIGQKKTSAIKKIKTNRITVDVKRQEMHLDTEYENYSLILFDFGAKKLASGHKQVTDFIKNRIKPNSVVTISGYTDALGDEIVNEKIALERAKAVSQRLQIRNAIVRGIGEKEILYDNNLPEGRFYCRTVTITIETPINKE